MGQVSYGTIAITDLTDIKDMYLQYCMAVDSVTTAAAIEAKTTWTSPEVNWFTLTADTTVNSNKRYYRLSSGDYYVVTPIGSENPSSNGWYEDTVYPSWQSGYQIWIREVRIKEGIELPEYGTPYLDKAVNQINTRIKKIWSNSTGSYMASGIDGNDVRESDTSTYGFNSKTTTTGISFNYNNWKTIELDGNVPALKFYEPSKTSQGTQTVQIDSNGMKLLKGGIEAGQAGQNGFVYLSTIDYSNSITINGYTPTSNNPKWRQIIGTNFGVDSEGNLYANNANISGTIDATSFSAKYYDNSNVLQRQMSLDASGLVIQDGTSPTPKTLAKFGITTQIGKDESAHLNLGSNELILYDGSNDPFFKIRNAVNESGQVTDTFAGDGEKTEWTLSYYASDTSYTVTQNGDAVSPTKTNTQITFSTAPAVGDTIVVVYNTVGNSAKAYDLGIRKTNTISGSYSVIEGITTTASGLSSHAEGHTTTASGPSSHAEGMNTIASETCSHAEGYRTTASGEHSHAEGYKTKASGYGSHAEGDATTASGFLSHVEGSDTTASGNYSHAEGVRTIASGGYSHAEGYHTTASGSNSHAEGSHTTAGGGSHAEGISTIASGAYSHAEGGSSTTASGAYSHAEGVSTTASGTYSHAEGWGTIASGNNSHSQNRMTIAAKSSQTALGTYNIEDASDTTTHPSGTTSYGQYALIVGNGTSDTARSNALTVDWDGNVEAAGGVIVNKTDNAKNLVYTGEYVAINANQTASTTAGQLTLTTAYQNVLLANKYNVGTSPLGDELYSVSNGVVTLLKAGRYKLHGQVYLYNGFTANDQVTACILYNGNPSILRGARTRAITASPYITLQIETYVVADANGTLQLVALNDTAARGKIGLSLYTNMFVECLGVYE